MKFKYKLQILIYPFIIFPVILIISINFFINASKTKDIQYEILENHLNNILSICDTEYDLIKKLKMEKDQYYSDAVMKKVLSEITKNSNQNEKTFIISSKTKKLVYFTGLNNDLRKKSLTNIKYVDDMINIKNGRMEFTEQIDEKSKKMNIAVYKYYPEWDWLIAVSLSKDNLYKYVYSSAYLSFLIAAIFLIILIIILYMISLGISKPLEQLEEGTIKIAQNDYDVNINIKSSDEFGYIAKKFNIMADKIKEYSINNSQIIKDLQESKKNFRTVADFTYDWETWISPEGKFIYVSPSCLRITGYTAEDFVNDFTLFTKIIHPNDRAKIEKHLQEILKKNAHECSIEFRIITRNNEERWIEHTCQGIFSADGKWLGQRASNRDATIRKQAEEELRESEKKVLRKLNALLSPDTDIGELELSDIIDSEKIQNLMDEFYRLTNIGIGIIDLKGNVLVGTGWQDICTKFHRINKESCQLCIESDLELSRDVPDGAFKEYKCKNNMWDIATPIMLGDRHVGNIFLGQFLYDDEKPDYEIFRQQARRYGFNEKEYIAALNRVPRWNRQKVEAAMTFYAVLAGLIGNLSYSNIKLTKVLEDRKRVDKILRENEERYKMAQAIGHVGNWEYNLKTTEFWESNEAKRIYGFDPDQFNFSTDEVEKCIPERERVHQALVDLIEKDKPYNLEFEIHPLNSSKPKIIMSIADLIKDENGVPSKVIGVIHDITDKKQAEEHQILSLRILKDLNDRISKGDIIKNILMEIKQSTGFEAIGIRLKQKEDFPYYTTNGFSENFVMKEKYLCSKDTEGNIIYDNNGKVSYECLCGYILSQKKSRKKSFFTKNGGFWANNSTILVKNKLLDDLQIKIRGRCIQEGYESIALIPIKTKKEIIGLLQINDHRKDCFTKEMITFFEGLASSIGIAIERKNTEEEIYKLNQELEKRVKERTIQLEATNKELEAFAYSVSHDLKTPLRSIDGFSQILLEEYYNNIDDKGKDYLQRVRSEAQRMGQLIEDMLNLSRITRNEMVIQSVNLSILIKDIADNFCKSQPERYVNIIIEPDIIVNGDANLLRIALENLFSNAWKFTSQHTKARIEFGMQKQQDKISYFIKDDGAGFNMNYSKKLFSPFQRLHTLKEFLGTGVGLAIVKRIIDRHGGNVWAEGEIENGAVFYFTIP